MLINGDLMVFQRNQTFTTSGSGGVKAIDGWRQGQSNVGQLVTETTRVDDAPANTGLKYSIKAQVKTPEDALAASEDLSLFTKVEGHDLQKLMYGTANAKTTTLSFWVKSSIAGTFAVRMYQADGDDNISKPYTINSANTWEYKTITYPGNTLAAIADDSTPGLEIIFYVSIGSNSTGGSNGDVWNHAVTNNIAFGHVTNTHITTDESTFQLTGVQFEMGSSASPFEFRTYDQALAKCQRYLFVQGGDGAYERFATGYNHTSTQARAVTFFPVEMRATPAEPTFDGGGSVGNLAVANKDGVPTNAVTSIAVDYNSPTVGHVKYNHANSGGSAVAGDGIFIVAFNTTDARLCWSAEL
jgi:hypothetical protein